MKCKQKPKKKYQSNDKIENLQSFLPVSGFISKLDDVDSNDDDDDDDDDEELKLVS